MLTLKPVFWSDFYTSFYSKLAIIGFLIYLQRLFFWYFFNAFHFILRSFDGTLNLFASKVETKTTERNQPSTVNIVNLERHNLPNIDNLDQLGFFKLLEDDVTTTTQSQHDVARTTHRNSDISKTKHEHNVNRDISKWTNRNETNTKKKMTFVDLKKILD